MVVLKVCPHWLVHQWRPGDLVIYDNRCLLHRACDYDGTARARSHCHFGPPSFLFTPHARPYSAPLFLKRQCDRTLGAAPRVLRSVHIAGDLTTECAARHPPVRPEALLARARPAAGAYSPGHIVILTENSSTDSKTTV
jgi:hypothetical protein